MRTACPRAATAAATAAPLRLADPCISRHCFVPTVLPPCDKRKKNVASVSAKAASVDSQVVPPPQQAPPPETKYSATLNTLPLTSGVVMLRVECTERLPEVGFNLRRGTTTNSYLLKGSKGGYEALIDVPSKAYSVDFAQQLATAGAAGSLRHIIITRLSPERVPVLAAVIQACQQPGLQLRLTNPAAQLLRERAAADAGLATALERVQVEVVNRSSELRLGSGRLLRFIPIPTPRWPDLMSVYSASDNILFSSNYFSAHVAPSLARPGATGGSSSALDDGGWSTYGSDWRYYYECMLAPVARQVAIAAVHAGAALHCWPNPSAALAEISRVLRPGGVFVASTFLNFAAPLGQVLGDDLVRPLSQVGQVLGRIQGQVLGDVPLEPSPRVYKWWEEQELRDLCNTVGLVGFRRARSNRFILLSACKPGEDVRDPAAAAAVVGAPAVSAAGSAAL